MKLKIPVGSIMMLAAVVLSLLPAAFIMVQPAAALAGCDRAQFIADLTIPDGSTLAPGSTFTKTWRVKNIGTCTWTNSYALVFSSGNQLGGSSAVNLPNSVGPGQSVDLSVDLTAPSDAGHYIGYWMLKNSSGAVFGIGVYGNKPWWVEINVTSTGSGNNVAYDFAADYCSANWYGVQGSLPCPGSDGDSHGFALKVDAPQLEDGTIASGSGIIAMPANVYNGDIHGAFPPFHVQAGDRFQSVVNCAYGATSCYVTFRLDYQIGNGPVYTAWSFREKYEGLYYHVNLDLSRLAGHDVKFILTVLASGSAAGDRALWSSPVIVRTGIAPASTATPWPGPTATPIPPSACDRAQFIADVTVPDGSIFAAGTEFDKIWRLKNIGSCTWTTSYSMVFDTGERMTAPDAVAMPMTVPPGSMVDVPVHLKAPPTAGSYRGYWMFQNANGVRFGLGASGTRAWWVDLTVIGTSDTPTPTVTQAATPTPPTATPTPITSTPPTPTPTRVGGDCDRVDFLGNVNVPDGTLFGPGISFPKTWRLQNTGTCSWTPSYKIVFVSGNRMGAASSIALPSTVLPGQVVDLTLNLTAPTTPGSYRGFWILENANGLRFGIGPNGDQPWWVDIRVTGGTPTPTLPGAPSDTPTPTPTRLGGDCDSMDLLAYFVADGTVFAPGEKFYQTWRIRNIGTCTWTSSYSLVFLDGDRMGADYSYPLIGGSLVPGQTFDRQLTFTAPSTPGSYTGYWVLRNAAGVLFGWGPNGDYPLWVDIQVAEPTATPTQPSATPTITPTITPTTTASPIVG